ncbi:unnamed protein product [Trichobilharzia regenti]|nr:unnamed protein product [Trichobilharzia regenti]
MRKSGKPSIAYKLPLEDISKAKLHILKLVQRATFPDEIGALRSTGSDSRNIANGFEVGKVGMSNELLRHMRSSCKAMKGGTVLGSTIKKLNPFVVDDTIRVGGRLQLSCLPFDNKHPITFPSKHFVTDMIVMHCHLQNAHAGIMHVLNSLRKEFWIIKGYSTVRRVLKQSYLCKRLNTAQCSQIMAPLPECRLKAHVSPFNSVEPFFTKKKRC